MASGHASIHNGAVRSTNAALPVVCGFRPRSVKLFLASGAEAFWNDQMDDGSAFKRVTGGTGSFITSDGITPADDGFSIGADGDINPSSESIIYFEALQ